MTPPRVETGWLLVDYDGADLSQIEIGFGPKPREWYPAFLDYDLQRRRVAKIRPPKELSLSGPTLVWLRINGVASVAGPFRV